MIAAATRLRAQPARREAVRKRIVRLVFVVFLLLIFEGALRKWVLPEFQRQLYFVRDPFVLLIYAYALSQGLIIRSPMLTALGLFAIFTSAFHLILLFTGTGNPISWALGVRHYFLYIPLAFIIGYCFRFEDLAALVRLNLLLAVPIAALVFLQYQSPPSAWINRAFSEDIDSITLVAGEILRPYGTFTSPAGHVLYAAASVAMLAAGWLGRREMRLPLWLLLPGGGAVMVMALVTGSRMIWFFFAAIGLCLGAVFLSAASFRDSFKTVILFVLAAVAVVGLYRTVLVPAYEAMLVRVEVAARGESIEGRAVNMFTSGFKTAAAAPIQGFGLGSGILAAVAVTSGDRSFSLAEGEWQRIVFELGPIFGLLFIALRSTVVAWLLWRALVANRIRGNPTALMLFGFAGVHVLVGQLTMSGTGAIFGWLMAGFVLAATQQEMRQPAEDYAAAARAAHGPRTTALAWRKSFPRRRWLGAPGPWREGDSAFGRFDAGYPRGSAPP